MRPLWRSILADELIYRYMGRADKGNTSNSRTTAEGYLGNLREVLDVVVENTDPGEFRDGLLRRFVRVEMLNRLSDRRFSSMDADQRAAWFDATQPLVADFAGPGVDRQGGRGRPDSSRAGSPGDGC